MKQFWTDLSASLFHPERNLNVKEQTARDHIDKMKEFLSRADGQTSREMNDWLVSNLDTLDRKQQSILILNSVVLAAAAILFPTIRRDLGSVALWVMVGTIAVLTYACISLALTNAVYWTRTDEFQASDSEPLFLHLLALREWRTKIVWRAVLLVIICLVAIFGLIVADAVSA